MTSVCTDRILAAAESAALSLGYSSLKPEQRDVIVEFVLGVMYSLFSYRLWEKCAMLVFLECVTAC